MISRAPGEQRGRQRGSGPGTERRSAWCAFVLVVSAALWGCESCGTPAIAELVEASGEVGADLASSPGEFAPTAVGRRFSIGEAVRTGAASTAGLTLAGGGSLHVDPDSVVRFSRTAENNRVEVETGSLVVEAPTTAAIEIETVFGVARLDAASRARIGPGNGRFEVVIGHATVESDSSTLEVAIGESVLEDGTLAVAAEEPVLGEPDAPLVVAPTLPSGASRTIGVSGTAASVRAPGETAFIPLAAGARELADGSTVRGGTGTVLDIPTATGRLRVEGDSEIELVPESARVVRGTAVASGGGGMRIELPGGALILAGAPGSSSARLEIRGDGSGTVTALSGEVRHESAAGATTLRAPELIALGAAGTPSEPSEVGATEGVEAPGEGDAIEGDAAEGGTGEGGIPDVTVRAGESVVIHDPSAPTRVGLELPADCGVGSFRFEGRGPRAARSSATVVRSVAPGTLRYTLTCASGTEASGSIRVDRDRGLAMAPRTAPRTVVDADGRPYSVLYQTLLPEIVFRWPRAPGSGPFVITVRRGGNARTVNSPTPSYTFDSGELAEGTHTLSFRAADGSVSPTTSVRIRFDNATPVASVRAPAPGVPLGATVHVEGTAAEDADVSAGGLALAMGEGGRFQADVPVPASRCLAIRVAVRSRGVHYFMRCED